MSGDNKKDSMIRRSWIITGGSIEEKKDKDYWITRSGPRSQLYAAGYKEEDFRKPTVTVSAPYMSQISCNQRCEELIQIASDCIENTYEDSENKKGDCAQLPPMKAYANMNPVVSDAQTMGTDGMKMSLVSRDLIADCIELMINAYCTDGALTFGGCDKTNPAAVMPLARNNVIGISVYPGTSASGKHPKTGERLSTHSPFEATGSCGAGLIDIEELVTIEKHSCPGSGTCAGMFTANTMSTCIEALGMIIPNSSTTPALDKNDAKKINEEVIENVKESVRCLKRLMEKEIRVRDILTKEAFENSITIMMALGGSTNGVLHLLALAAEANVDLSIMDFNTIADRVPLIGNLYPEGQYNAVDLHAIGGLPIVMKHLLHHGLIHGDCLTVTGKTVRENLSNIAASLPTNQDVIYPVTNPIAPPGRHILVLNGSLAPGGCVIKLSGKDFKYWEGPVRVCDNEKHALQCIMEGKLQKGEALIIRYEGPCGSPGMPEMLGPSSAIVGRGLGPFCPLITDGRYSGASHGIMIGHVVPEAMKGGPIALIETGDRITIDINNRKLDFQGMPADELERRHQQWKSSSKQKDLSAKQDQQPGILKKYSKLVSDASQGAICR